MKNLKAKAVCVMLSASMAAMGLTGCGSDNVDGTKTAITVNDESITLGKIPGKTAENLAGCPDLTSGRFGDSYYFA